jgi:hypothetical protein
MLDAAAWFGVDNENFVGQGGDEFVSAAGGVLVGAAGFFKPRK